MFDDTFCSKSSLLLNFTPGKNLSPDFLQNNIINQISKL